MKPWITAAVALAIACTIAFRVISARLEQKNAEAAVTREAAWQKKQTELAAALKKALQSPPRPTAEAAAAPTGGGTPTAAELIVKLKGLKAGKAAPTRLSREAIHGFEQLIGLGPAALPAIREFLARDEEVDFAFAGAAQTKVPRSLPYEFLVPPSLRFGLFDALVRIGGAAAEDLLAEVLGTTGRGVELAWIARALQRLSPDKYRNVAVNGARELLDRPLAAGASPLDRNDRDSLFGVLTMYGDTGYVASAQTQLIQADGTIDRDALVFIQKSLGPQSVPVAAQAWNDARLTDPAKKEPLARIALAYAGADQQANEFYVTAINDMGLSKDQRSNLIEDLNEDGFANFKKLTAADLPLIESRIALIEQLAPSAADDANAAAFKEAHKDLVNMRQRITNPPEPVK